MPAGKRPETNNLLYTLIIFVGLFIIAVVAAIVFYIKFEEQRTIATTSRSKLEEMSTASEQRKGLGNIVGTIPRGKSGLGTMVDYLDEMVSLIIGGLPEDASAEVKVGTANRDAKETLELLAQEYPDTIGNAALADGLVRTIQKLKMKLDNTTGAELAAQEQLKELQERFGDAMAIGLGKEQTLLAEKERYQQQVNDIKQDYNELKALTKQTTKQQVQILSAQLDEEKANRKELTQELLKIQAEFKMAQDRMKRIQEELQQLVPPPDSEVAAFKSDGKIILIDDRAKLVHLNIGSDDHVYRGLTFSVYDKGMPIPKAGKGKGEIEVFNVGKSISAARVVRSEIKRPIVLDDIVANLIWDSDKTNVFVVAGEFDLDGDGDIDYGAVDKIKALIKEWGGRVNEAVSIGTDFLVLGEIPEVLRRPTFEQMEIDPMAMEKYEASLQKLAHYNEVKNGAQTLWIPVFNYERFLYFIGYKTQSSRPGAF